MPSIADLFITVSSDVSGAVTGLTDVDRRINGTTSAMQAAAPAAYALAGASAAVGAGFLAAIGEATSFEHQMNGIKAVMSPTEVLTFGDAVEQLALRLGRDTVFSSGQAANAIEELIKSGVPLPAILSGAAAAALNLAAATGIDTAQAATFAATAMNTFHVAVEGLPAIMDTIANVSNATATDVGGLQLAFSQIGPVAAGLGLSFADTAQALGVFANNGLRGSDAGTSLKTMLLNLEPSTKTQIAAFRELGLVTEDGTNKFFDASGSARSMSEIFEILKQSTAGLTDQQKIHLLQTAFGTDAVRAATIAASEGAAGWDRVTDSMEKMGGVQVAATQRNAGLTGAMNQLGGAIEALQINIGDRLLPVLTIMAQHLTSAVNAFAALDPTIQTVIITAVGIAGAIAGVSAAFILLGPLLASAGAGFGIILAAVAPISLPLLAIAAAVAALYFAWQTNFGGIQEVTAQVWTAIQPALVNIQNFLAELGAAIGPTIQALATNLAPVMAQLSALVGEWLALLPGAIVQLGDFFNSISATIQLLTTGDFQGGIFGLDEDSGFVLFLLVARDTTISLWNALQLLITGDFQGGIFGLDEDHPAIFFLIAARDTTISLWNALQLLITGDFQGGIFGLDEDHPVIGFLIMARDFVSSLNTGVGVLITGQYSSGFFGLSEDHPVIRFMQLVQSLTFGILGTIGSLIGTALTDGVFGLGEDHAVIRFFQSLGNAIAQIPTMIGNLGDVWAPLSAAFGDLVNILSPAWDAFAGWLGSVVGGLPQFIADSMGFVFGALATAFNDIVPLLAPYWDAFAGWFASVLGGIPQFVVDNMGFIFGGIIQAFADLVANLAPYWDGFAAWLAAVVGGIPQFIADNAGDIFGAIVNAALDLPRRVGEAIEPIRQLLADTFGNFWGFLTGAVPLPGGGGEAGGGGTPAPSPGGTSPLVYVGTLIISSQEEANAFLDLVAQAVLASTRRVSPPVAGANPALP